MLSRLFIVYDKFNTNLLKHVTILLLQVPYIQIYTHLELYELQKNIVLNIINLYYCSSSQLRNFSIDTDSITIGIELCKIPHISEHWP